MHYTYRIDFVDGFFYHGSKKNDKGMNPEVDGYYGSPITHKEKWSDTMYSKTVLETFSNYEKCRETEDELIRDHWGHPMSLNRACAGMVMMTDEIRRKISKANKGKIVSEETKQKLKDNHVGMKGKQHSEETRQKMSESQKGNSNGKGYRHTEESKQKMSEAKKGINKGKPSNRKGVVLSDETKRKMSEAQKARWTKETQ